MPIIVYASAISKPIIMQLFVIHSFFVGMIHCECSHVSQERHGLGVDGTSCSTRTAPVNDCKSIMFVVSKSANLDDELNNHDCNCVIEDAVSLNYYPGCMCTHLYE